MVHWLRSLTLVPAVAVCLLGAARDSEAWRFNIPAQSAIGGLNAFSRQASTVQILMSHETVRARRTNALKGDYTADAGLSVLLQGSGLQSRRTGPSTYSIVVARDQRRTSATLQTLPGKHGRVSILAIGDQR